MTIVFTVIVAIATWAIFLLGRSYGKKMVESIAVPQNEAPDGVYSILGKVQKLHETIIVAERHDGEIVCLILESDTTLEVFRLINGHMITFPLKS